MDPQLDQTEPPPPIVFECGCLIVCEYENGQPVAKLSACSQTCRVVELALEEAADQDKPVQYREA